MTKYLTKEILLEAIDAGMRENRSHLIPRKLIEDCDDDFIFVVHHIMYHSEKEIRLMITIDFTEVLYTIDIGISRFNTLPTSSIDEKENIKLESKSETRKKRPYGDRKFEERTQVKPVREHSFRKMILKSYDNQCCLCSVKEPLVTAHIVPVCNKGSDQIDNGILLCKNHDHLFEFGKIKIFPDGNVISENPELCQAITIRFPKDKNSYPSPDNFKRKLELINNSFK